MGKGLAKLASALGHSEEESPASAGSGHKKSLLGITDGMEEMSKGFIAMTGVSLLPVPGVLAWVVTQCWHACRVQAAFHVCMSLKGLGACSGSHGHGRRDA